MTAPPADIAVPIGVVDSLQPRSLTDVHSSIAIPYGASSFWTKLRAFAGPGFLVAVGYMDPGNWATGIAAGSAFGYQLLSVVLLSSLIAVVLQSLAAKLGIATGRDLAQACRDSYGPQTRLMLWAICELAIIACDLAEVIGTAIALNLLFGLPLVAGVCVTAFDVCLMLYLQNRGFRKLEAFVIALIAIIGACFAIELALAGPSLSAIVGGLRPSTEVVRNPAMLYLSIGIIGATVMPHNLYLHSAIVQTRSFGGSDRERREASRFATIDSSIALGAAFLINAAILILAAAAFHRSGHTGVTEIQNAYRLLSPLLGTGIASVLFAVALLASGQNSTITATLAGQVIMEGFLNIRLPAWQRRLLTRLIAIVPAAIVAASYGMSGTANLLLLSQVALSLQLPFAIVPLVRFTSDRSMMGSLVNPRWLKITSYVISGVIIALNLQLLRSVL